MGACDWGFVVNVNSVVGRLWWLVPGVDVLACKFLRWACRLSFCICQDVDMVDISVCRGFDDW